MAAVLAAAALTACTAAGPAGKPDPRPTGAVSIPPPAFSSLGEKHGSAFTDGLTVFSLHGDKKATVTAVRPDPVAGLELLGVQVADGTREIAAIQFTRSWPPVDPDLPPSSIGELPAQTPLSAEGADGLELLIGYRVTGRGRLVRKGVWVDYTAGGKDYSAYLPSGLAVCVGPDEDAACHPPQDWPSTY